MDAGAVKEDEEVELVAYAGSVRKGKEVLK